MEVGAGVLTAAALTAAGAYLLADKGRRKKVKVWASKARKDIARNVKVARKMSEGQYQKLVDQATKRYAAMHDVDMAELAQVARDLKGEWRVIQKNARVMAKAMKGGNGKSSRRPARRTAKRSSAKKKRARR